MSIGEKFFKDIDFKIELPKIRCVVCGEEIPATPENMDKQYMYRQLIKMEEYKEI